MFRLNRYLLVLEITQYSTETKFTHKVGLWMPKTIIGQPRQRFQMK